MANWGSIVQAVLSPSPDCQLSCLMVLQAPLSFSSHAGCFESRGRKRGERNSAVIAACQTKHGTATFSTLVKRLAWGGFPSSERAGAGDNSREYPSSTSKPPPCFLFLVYLCDSLSSNSRDCPRGGEVRHRQLSYVSCATGFVNLGRREWVRGWRGD